MDEAEIDRLTAARRSELGLSTAEHERGAELDRLAARLLGERQFAVFRELAVLPRELSEDEEVLDLAYAHLFFGGGLLVLTDRQILFVNHRILLPGVTIKSFPLGTVRAHSVVMKRDFGRLRLWFNREGWNADCEFDNIKPAERALAIEAKLSELLGRPADSM